MDLRWKFRNLFSTDFGSRVGIPNFIRVVNTFLENSKCFTSLSSNLQCTRQACNPGQTCLLFQLRGLCLRCISSLTFHVVVRVGFTMGQMGQLPRAPTNSTNLGGPTTRTTKLTCSELLIFQCDNNRPMKRRLNINYYESDSLLIWSKYVSCFVSCKFMCLKFSSIYTES